MQLALMPLFGPHRGQVEVFGKDVIRFGTDPATDLVMDPGLYPSAAPVQAEFRYEDHRFLLLDITRSSLWVNDQRVSEAFLASGRFLQARRRWAPVPGPDVSGP